MTSLEAIKINQKKTSTDPEEEPKTYINFYVCKLSLNIIYTMTYIIVAVFLNIVNRMIFYKYQFNNYNFSFMLLQQIFCIIFFYIVSHKSETFKVQAGEITLDDFLKLKFYFISFSILFMANTIIIFVGTQMIINASMFQTLRKLVLVKIYFIDLYNGKKTITFFTSVCVFMVTIGSVLAGADTFSRDYMGIALTMVSNFVNVAYNKYTESFRKSTGVPNLKLLVYNSYIAGPILVVLILVTGEYKKIIAYFNEQKYLGETGTEGSFYGFFITLSISCTLVIILNSSFFMSNEKNSSMFTNLMANTKDLLTCILSRFMLAGNKFTVNIVLGLTISTIGAVMFSSKSIWDNMKSGSIKNKEPDTIETTNDNIGPGQEVQIKMDESNSS